MKKLFILFVCILSILNANIDEAKKAYHTEDFKKALPMFEQLSKDGNAEANYYLGTMYAFPYGVKQDYKKAFDYYIMASNQPNKRRLKSIFNIAIMYSKGWGIKKNQQKAFDFFKILDKKNIGVAQYMMGIMYENGIGVKSNWQNAILYYEKGCNSKKTYPKACYYAGDYYEKGIGVEENYEIAKKYYDKGCELGSIESCEASKNMKEPKSFFQKYAALIIVILLLIAWLRSRRAKKVNTNVSV